MADAASLSFAIDSSDTRRAKTDLDAMRASASDVAEAQVRFNKAVAEGRDPVRALREEFALFDRDSTNAQRGIDGLIDRVNRLTQAMASNSASMRDLRESVGQIEAAASAFNTTSVAMEMFVRTSRTIGISSSETTGALQRITSALREMSDEGSRARQVMRDYGVATDGRGPGDAATVLREFTEKIRSYRTDTRTGSDLQAVLGQMSTAGIAAVLDPDYRSIGQRQRELTAGAESQRVAELRNGLVLQRRDSERRAAETNDLEREYGSAADGFSPRRWFQSAPGRRAELEARRDSGQQSRSAYEESDAYVSDPLRQGARFGDVGIAVGSLVSTTRAFGRAQRWLGSDEYSLRNQTINEDANDDGNSPDFWTRATAGFRGAGRLALNAVGRGEVTPRQDTRPVNERTGAYNAETETLSAQGFMLPANQDRQRQIIAAAQSFGVDTNGFAEMLPQDIMARLSPGQRAAVDQRETAQFQVGMFQLSQSGFQASRRTAIARGGSSQIGPVLEPGGEQNYGLEPFQGSAGVDATEASADRAQRVADIVIRAENAIADARERGARIRAEVAQLDARLDEQRERSADTAARRVRDTGQDNTILASTASTSDIGAQLRRAQAVRASEQPGGLNPEETLQLAAVQEAQRVNIARVTARRQGERQDYQVGALRAGQDEGNISDDLAIMDRLAPMREIATAMRDTVGETSEKYQAIARTLREMEASLRTQLEAEKQRTREITEQRIGRQIQASALEEARLGGDTSIAQRGRREGVRALALQNRPAPEGTADPASWIEEQMAGDPEFRGQMNRLFDQRNAENGERARLGQEQRLRQAGTGGTGNPTANRQAARDRELEELRNSWTRSPEELAREEEIRRTQWATEDANSRNAPLVALQQQRVVTQARTGGYAGVTLSERDLDVAGRIVATEEGPRDGRLGVAASMLNRLRALPPGSSLAQVGTAPGQYEPWGSGRAQSLAADNPRLLESRRLIEDLVAGREQDPTGGAQNFYGRAEMARRVANGGSYPRWMLGQDGQLAPGVDIAGTRFLRTDAGGAEQRLWGGDSTRRAAAAEYGLQNPGADVGAYNQERLRTDADTSIAQLATTTDRLAVSFQDLQRSALTPFQRGLAEAMDAVRPMVTEARRIAQQLPEGPQRASLLQGANRVEQEVRTNYVGGLRAQQAQQDQNTDDQIEDLRLQTGLYISGTALQRDLGQQQRRRQLQRTRPDMTPEEVDTDIAKYGTLSELREQARTMGLIRDSWSQIGNSGSQALERIILQGGKATDVMKQLLAEMASYAIRAGTRLAVEGTGNLLQQGLGFVGGLLGGGGGGAAGANASWASSASEVGPFLMPAATGAVLSTPASLQTYHPMAQGGMLSDYQRPSETGGRIFSHAQYVPMAGGGTALVGEAGDEAAVPLVRTASGNLGVRVSGGGSGPAINNNFNVNVNGGSGGGGGGGDGKRMGNDIARSLEGMVTAVMVRQLSPGGVLTDSGRPVQR